MTVYVILILGNGLHIYSLEYASCVSYYLGINYLFTKAYISINFEYHILSHQRNARDSLLFPG